MSAIAQRWGKRENVEEIKEVVKTVCLEEVNAISLARLSLIVAGEPGKCKFICVSGDLSLVSVTCIC